MPEFQDYCLSCPKNFHKDILFDPYWQTLLAPLLKEFTSSFKPHLHWHWETSYHLDGEMLATEVSRLSIDLYIRTRFDGGYVTHTVRIREINDSKEMTVYLARQTLRNVAYKLDGQFWRLG